ncbi:MAG: class II aldolase/adducin family protein [Bdellovibrionales bacterium]
MDKLNLNEQQMKIAEQMLAACQQMDARGFVANHDGNLSHRLEQNLYLVTPTAFAKRSITKEDLLLIDDSGKVLKGQHKVFSEWKWHQAIYKANPQVNSVCHAHPPYSMAWGLTGKDFGFSAIPESLVSLGGPLQLVPLPSPLTPSPEIEREVRVALDTSYAFLVQGNGVFAVGDHPEMSYLRVELVEQIVRAHFLAREIGSIKNLPSELVQELIQKRPPLKPEWQELKKFEPSVPVPVPEIKPTSSAITVEEIKSVIRREIESLLQTQK